MQCCWSICVICSAILNASARLDVFLSSQKALLPKMSPWIQLHNHIRTIYLFIWFCSEIPVLICVSVGPVSMYLLRHKQNCPMTVIIIIVITTFVTIMVIMMIIIIIKLWQCAANCCQVNIVMYRWKSGLKHGTQEHHCITVFSLEGLWRSTRHPGLFSLQKKKHKHWGWGWGEWLAEIDEEAQ